MTKVLIATEKPFAPVAVDGIRKIVEGAGFELVLLEKYTERQQLLDAAKDVDAIIVRSDKIQADVFEAAKNLKIVVRAGAGYDNVDLEAATKHNVCVMNTPGQNSNAVAELAFALMLGMVRNHFNGKSGSELKGKKLGIQGFGHIGRCLAKIAQGFGMEVYYNKRHRLDAAEEKELGITYCSQEDLFKQCDIVSLNTPKTAETVKSINGKYVKMMPQGGVIVNTARKEIIDEECFLAALKERTDVRYATDIAPDMHEEYQKELQDRYLATAKKMGAQTAEANINAGLAAANQIVGFIKDGCETFRVN